MLRHFVSQINGHSTRSGWLLNSLKLPLIGPKQFQCTLSSRFVEHWIDSLAEDKRKRVKLIQNEIALKQAELKKVPQLDTITIDDFEEMLEMSTSRRHRYYDYLFSTKTAQANDEIKKLIRQKVFEEKKKLDILGAGRTKHIDYGLGKNTMILKVTRRTGMSWRNQKMHRAIMLNEAPLIFDCGFCDTMSKFEIRDTARQIKYAFSENRYSHRPFVMHLCNMDRRSLLWHELCSQLKNIEKLPLKVHDCDVTELFPIEKLVYLSPDSGEVMREFNEDDRYVVGGIVDKGNQMPLTLAKAKKLQIRTVRLPLDKYIRFHSHKTLTLDQMMKILLTLKHTQDWSKALKHVPGRKVFS